MEWTGNVSAIADVNAAATNITMNGSYNITANFIYSILLAANLAVEQVIAASIAYFDDIGEWPHDTTSTSGNYSFSDYIDVILKASYSFDHEGFIDGVGDPGGTGGGTISSGWPGIHWEDPILSGHGRWVTDY